MNKLCNVCGHAGEAVWRDNKYYCAMCGSEINVADPNTQPNQNNAQQNAGTPIYAVCPVCKNATNNYLIDGQCRCSMCGTTFVLNQPNNNYNNGYNANGNYGGYNPMYGSRRFELENERNRKIKWGIVWLILFWPISIYYFYKAYQISQELSRF